MGSLDRTVKNILAKQEGSKMETELIAKNVMNAIETSTFALYEEETEVRTRAFESSNLDCVLEDNANTIRALVCKLAEINDCIDINAAEEQKEKMDQINGLIRTLGNLGDILSH